MMENYYFQFKSIEPYLRAVFDYNHLIHSYTGPWLLVYQMGIGDRVKSIFVIVNSVRPSDAYMHQ